MAGVAKSKLDFATPAMLQWIRTLIDQNIWLANFTIHLTRPISLHHFFLLLDGQERGAVSNISVRVDCFINERYKVCFYLIKLGIVCLSVSADEDIGVIMFLRYQREY